MDRRAVDWHRRLGLPTPASSGTGIDGGCSSPRAERTPRGAWGAAWQAVPHASAFGGLAFWVGRDGVGGDASPYNQGPCVYMVIPLYIYICVYMVIRTVIRTEMGSVRIARGRAVTSVLRAPQGYTLIQSLSQ